MGLGAAGYIGNIRYKNTSSINNYIKGQYRLEEETLTDSDELTYQIMLNLRTYEGLDLSYIKKTYSYDIESDKKEVIEQFVNNGYLKITDNKLIATHSGMMILDQIIVALLPYNDHR